MWQSSNVSERHLDIKKKKLRSAWILGIPATFWSRIFCLLLLSNKYKDYNAQRYNFFSCFIRVLNLVFSLKEEYRSEYFNQVTKQYIPVEFWIYSCWIYCFVDWLQYSLVFSNDTGIRHLKVKEEHRSRVFKNWVLREVIETKLGEGTGNCRKFNSVALHDLLVLHSKRY